jgi:hypothetical protein
MSRFWRESFGDVVAVSDEPAGRRMIPALVAGSCYGFERWRQGTRDELVDLQARYLTAMRG